MVAPRDSPRPIHRRSYRRSVPRTAHAPTPLYQRHGMRRLVKKVTICYSLETLQPTKKKAKTVTNEQEYTSLPMLIRDMAEAGDNQWADEYDDALGGGATGGEIQARVGNFFDELRQSEIAQRPEFRQLIRDMIDARSPHRSEVENVIIPVNDPDIVRVKALALAKTLRDADERDWTEGIEYALGHGGLGNILGELYSADAGRRLALQPILLDLYRYNLELPHSSPATLPLTSTDQFYQRVEQLIADLEMLGETLACSDL